MMVYGAGHFLGAMVNPGFLVAGAALATIPVVIHLLNRRRFKVVPWAAMEYLLAALKQNRRRLRFEQWLLLAVRCLALGLMGLALARPLACDRNSLAALAAQRSGLHVLVIDNSYSMAYAAQRPDARTHLDQAKRLARQLVDRLGGAESVAVITAGAPATAVVATPSGALDAVRGAIDRIEQSYAATDLPGALRLALRVGRQWPGDERSLYVLTDATRSAWEGPSVTELKELGPALGALYRITHFDLGERDQWNQAALDVRPAANLVATKLGDSTFIADVKGYGAPAEALLQWRLDEQVLPGGGTLRLDTQTPPQAQMQPGLNGGGTHVVSVTLVGDDRLPIDNTRWNAVRVVSELRVLIVEGDRGAGALSGSAAFLELALAPPSAPGESDARTASYVAPERISDLELGNRVLGDYRAVILTNVGQVSAAQADQLRQFVRGGGALIWFLGEQVQRENYNQVLLPRGLVPGMLTKRMSVGGGEDGFRFDFSPRGNAHPLLGAFRGEEKSGLDTAQVFTYWQVELSPQAGAERVLDFLPRAGGAVANPTTRDPAITAQTLGEGRVVFVTTTANADWTSLPAKPAYVTLVHELLSGSVNSGDAWMNLRVGDRLTLPRSLALSGAPILTDPARRPVVLAQAVAGDDGARYQSPPLTHPGVYRLETGSRTLPIAVNLPSQEADVRTIDQRALRQALGDIEMTMLGAALAPLAVERDRGTDLGWSVMLLVLALVGFESVAARWFGHYRAAGSRQ